MRFLMTAAAAAFLLLPVSQQASACGTQHSAEADAQIVAQAGKDAATEAVAIDLSAKKKKEKVEYMKSAAGPEPKAKKHKKKKKGEKAKAKKN